MAILAGSIEAVTGRAMTGWVDASLPPGQGITVEFLADGHVFGSTVARSDAASGPDKLGFEFLLPRALFDGQMHEITARVDGNMMDLRNNAHRLGEVVSVPSEPPVGWLEVISEEGWVVGWSWYPDRPEERVVLEILVDGHPAGTTIAGLFRADVAAAGKGDGRYGFSWPLPFNVLGMPRDVMISAREPSSGYVLPKPILFRQKSVADALSKIGELENDVRLLNSTIADLERYNGQDDRAAAALFDTVGRFFSELAAASSAGAPLQSLRTLGAAVEQVTAGLAPFAYPACTAPDVTVFVEAAGNAAAMHEVLRAVADTMGGAQTEVFLLDEGASDDAALLPAVVGNLRYARLPGSSPVARRNDAMRLAAGKVVVFFGAGAKPVAGWSEALAAFGEKHLAAMAARVTGPDALLVNAGVDMHDGAPVPRGQRAHAHTPMFGESEPVDAVGAEVFAVQRDVWEKLGGLDEGFGGVAAALVAFCLHVRKGGNLVGFEPGFGAVQLASAAKVDGDAAAQLADMLRLREVIGSVG